MVHDLTVIYLARILLVNESDHGREREREREIMRKGDAGVTEHDMTSVYTSALQ